MPITVEHFNGCHPEHEHGPDTPNGYVPQDTEPCWHCSTMTEQGCYCLECAVNDQYVPSGSAYHCRRCGRWWAYMTGVNITTITFPGIVD